MNTKNTWTWLIVAAGMFAFILIERHWHQPAPGPAPVLSNFKAAAVTSVRVRPANLPEIRADRTNSAWLVTQPITFPGQKSRIEALLDGLEHLVPAQVITASELQPHPKADEEFGFENPQISLDLHQGDVSTRLKFGRRTAPGDQVFVQVVGGIDIYVVDAELLKLLPGSANEWRDPTLLDLRALQFDRISITNGGKVIVLKCDPTNLNWRINDNEPLAARADSRHILLSLKKLQDMSISQFVTDNAAADLDTFGLSPPGLSLAFSRATNPVALLQFGKTNGLGHYYARRAGINSVVTVPPEPLAAWREPFYEFRDRTLLALPAEFREVEVRAADNFVLQRGASNSWQLAAEKFSADPALVHDFLARLGQLEIVQFVQDAVTPPDLGRYGLTAPGYQVIFQAPAVAGLPYHSAPTKEGATNSPLAHLAFGTNAGDLVYARRADEDSVYAVKLADFQSLPAAGWQLRQRRLWNFAANDLARVVIHQSGKTRELIRHGTNSWGFAAGSQGMLNGLAVEESTRPFGELTATAWVARGAEARGERFGLTTNSLALTFALKGGENFDIQFGALSPAQYPYARVTLDGEPWVFEFSTALFELVLNYLTIPEAR